MFGLSEKSWTISIGSSALTNTSIEKLALVSSKLIISGPDGKMMGSSREKASDAMEAVASKRLIKTLTVILP